MKFSYGEFDGQPFPTPDSLFPQPRVMRLILQYGDKAMQAFEQMEENEPLQQLVQEMLDAGLLEETTDDAGNRRLRMTPKMLKGLQHQALEEIFSDLQQGHKQGHATEAPGRTTERTEGNKPYEFGDPISELDLGATMRQAVKRQVAERAPAGPGNRDRPGPALPIRLGMDDFELHQTEGSADVATVMLLDLSGSMMRYGRFYQAKRVALGMQGLIHTRFPQDTIDYVGFYSLAEPLRERDVPLVMPKPVTIYDYRVRIRMPLAQARQAPQRLPLHFTNLQMGLRTARQILARRGAANKQIFVVTDGQPTAHLEPGPTGEDMLYLLYPPDERTAEVTLHEALRCQQQGIRVATFALIEDYYGMDWVGFVDRLTRLTRGVAYYCTSEDLSSTLIESYLSGKKKKSFVH